MVRSRIAALAVTACLAAAVGMLATTGSTTTARAAREVPPPRTAAIVAGAPLTPDLGVQGLSAIVLDLDTHRVFWSRDADARRAPASLTKMVTAMVAADYAGDLQRVVTVPEAAADHPDYWTAMGLDAGERLSVRDLAAGMFVVSANDAAETLALTLAPSRAAFIAAMNAKVASLGLTSTHFANPTGLDAAGQVSTASDMAAIATALVERYPAVAALASLRALDIRATDSHKAYTAGSLNGMVLHYRGGLGLKTGYTDAAGGCLVSLVVRDGHRLLAVDLHSEIFVTDSMRLMDYAFSVLEPAPPPLGETALP